MSSTLNAGITRRGFFRFAAGASAVVAGLPIVTEGYLAHAQRGRRLGDPNRGVHIDSNENPLGCSPRARAAVLRALEGMERYPDGGLALRRKLAERFKLKVENVIVGAGSEGIMANVVRTFLCDRDEVLSTEAAFSGFQVLARGRGVAYRTVPYREWRYDLEALAEATSVSGSAPLAVTARPFSASRTETSACASVPWVTACTW